ncbi:3-ketoacyl-CoA synthase 5 [Dichanthelium oligosanthes]|uniref:3-ketoacyl-CoA synthase n=1 Tax=Dichanthelium oligosanthes TaxID=888268 RepID=A0A1E5UJT3_9POAL|nr:3-ketoacyl-CoA synthase 5 [Dichanthelium oligosanthes]
MSPSPIHKFLKIVYTKTVDNFLLIVPMSLTTAAIVQIARSKPNDLTDRIQALSHSFILLIGLFLSATAVTVYIMHRPRMVYLIDYACFRAPNTYRAPSATFVEHARQVSYFSDRSIRFLTRLLEKSGLGEETSVPPMGSYIEGYKYCTLEEARKEVELVVFSAIDDLFANTNIDPITIDTVIVNCSGFSPTPSMPDMIVNKYKMRSDIRSIHLSGMGCSAGLISVELAKNLLQAMPQGARALVVSTETLTPNYYLGNERAMLLPYCLFRMGGSAVLLSTSPAKARFRLKCIIRTLTAADDRSYHCIHQEEDDKGNTGANLSMDIVDVASNTLKTNITTIAPLILPASEKLLFALSFVSQKLLKMRTKLHMPNLLTAFEHICIHAGGRAVIDGIQRSLRLSDEHVEASRMTLHRFGNTSSSSMWYELAYIEAKGYMHKGNRVWMIGFGSGFKCNSAVWECIAPAHNEDGPWAGCINRYPVLIS